MTATDLTQVVAIEQASFSDPWSIGSFRHEITRPQYSCPLVLVIPRDSLAEPEQIIAYLVLWDLGDDLHIANIAIHPDWRKQGWGKKLIRTAFYLGQKWNKNRYMLEVRRNNTPAQQLYASLGFEVLAIRKNYYTSPVEDAIVLYHCSPSLELSPPIGFSDESLPNRRPNP